MRTGRRILAAARRLRREMSPPEVRLWLRLRSAGKEFPRFRRQHPIGPYVADFYCPAARLVVEVDGWAHNAGDHPQRDVRRDAWMTEHGLTVVRIAASEMLADPDGVADGLLRQAVALAKPPPPLRGPPPPLRRGGD